MASKARRRRDDRRRAHNKNADATRSTAAPRSKTHHFVPQLILRGFAKEGRVVTVRLADPRPFAQTVEKAAAENHYNTIRLADGSTSDEVEQFIANEIEAPASPPLARIASGGWFTDRREREAVTLFLAFQFVRVPWQRHRMDAMADKLMKLELAAGGPAKMRKTLEATEGRAVTDEEVEDAWAAVRDFDAWTLALPRERHVMDSLRIAGDLVPPLVDGFVWSVLRWERSRILTSDMPVLLTPYPDQPIWQGVGLLTAACIHFPLDRRSALVLSAPGVFDGMRDASAVSGTVGMARRLNRSITAGAHANLYHHPDDTLEQLLGADYELPGPMDPAFDRYDDNDLRDQLRSMSEWHAQHPDQPHPYSGQLPSPDSGVEPWSYDSKATSDDVID